MEIELLQHINNLRALELQVLFEGQHERTWTEDDVGVSE